VLALLRVARRCPGAVLDSTWFDYALPAARARRRHAGHLDSERTDQELWGEPPPSPGLGPVIEVDTSDHVDLDQLLARLERVSITKKSHMITDG
jgi:hypothetical protein